MIQGGGNSLDYEDDLLGGSLGDLDSEHGQRMEDGVLSPEDSDLAQLRFYFHKFQSGFGQWRVLRMTLMSCLLCFRSLNDGECSADWYNFQESVAHLQVMFFVAIFQDG